MCNDIETRKAARKATGLSAKQFKLLSMVLYGGKSIRKAGKIMGMPASTAVKMHKTAMNKLRAKGIDLTPVVRPRPKTKRMDNIAMDRTFPFEQRYNATHDSLNPGDSPNSSD